jgi:hypothetical protein
MAEGRLLNPLRWAKAEVLHLAWKRGKYTPPDRKLFEEEILPALASEPDVSSVLSVGVAWYTARYADVFGDKRFVTLDVDPSRAAFGAKDHVTGDCTKLEELFEAPFDVILMNGVIGYGLDDARSVDCALRACAARLRTGGTLVLGINEEKPTNVDPRSVPASASFASRALGRFDGRVVVPVPFRERTHTFLFWRRAA